MASNGDVAGAMCDGTTWVWVVADRPGIYRPWHGTVTFYWVVERDLGRYLGSYGARFEVRCGPLRGVAARAAEAFLECGRLQNGFARCSLQFGN